MQDESIIYDFRYLMMRKKLILICLAISFCLFIPFHSEAITLSSRQSELNGCGYNNVGLGSVRVAFESKLTVEGCLITPDPALSDIANGYLVAYIPYSCKTLYATGTVKVTNRDTDAAHIITSVGIEAEQGVNCTDGYRCAAGECVFDGACAGAWAGGPEYVYARGVKDSIADGDTMTLTQTIDVTAAAALNGEVELGNVGIVRMQFNESGNYDIISGTLIIFPNAGVTDVRMKLRYKDLASSGCPLLKGGAEDNPNTEFQG
jgi:hypothetical protein